MRKLGDIDKGKPFDWGRTSDDYAKYRPGYPDSFYELLRNRGIGLPGQWILDLGTGTGELALRFAAQGAVVTAEDVSANQVDAARTRAHERGLELEFVVRAAEECDFRMLRSTS
jgi:2-polyprenyl-3-methyl-5-hydroxy-6-metoxy-1,4-benzoquinol methylase